MRKRAWILLVVLVAALGALFVFTRPRVWYIDDTVPGYDFPAPSPLTAGWRLSGRDPSLVIVPPFSQVPDTEAFTVLFAREAEDGEDPDEVLLIDETALWGEALSGEVECLLYDSADKAAAELAARLLELDDNAFAVPYENRVSSTSFDSVSARAAGADRVFMLTPVSSIYFARNSDKDIVLDFRDSAALESTYVKYTVSIDMDRLTRSLLSGEAELPYTLLTAKE